MDIKTEIQHIFDSGANEIRIENLCEKYAKQEAMEFAAWCVYNLDATKNMEMNYKLFSKNR